MTGEEAIHKWLLPALKNTWNEKRCEEILKAIEQEPRRMWQRNAMRICVSISVMQKIF